MVGKATLIPAYKKFMKVLSAKSFIRISGTHPTGDEFLTTRAIDKEKATILTF